MPPYECYEDDVDSTDVASDELDGRPAFERASAPPPPVRESDEATSSKTKKVPEPIDTDAEGQWGFEIYNPDEEERKFFPLEFLDEYNEKSWGWHTMRSKLQIPERYIKRQWFKSPCLYDPDEEMEDIVEEGSLSTGVDGLCITNALPTEGLEDNHVMQAEQLSWSGSSYTDPGSELADSATLSDQASREGDYSEGGEDIDMTDGSTETSDFDSDMEVMMADVASPEAVFQDDEDASLFPAYDPEETKAYENDPSYIYFLKRLELQQKLHQGLIHPLPKYLPEFCNDPATKERDPEKRTPAAAEFEHLRLRLHAAMEILDREDIQYRCRVCDMDLKKYGEVSMQSHYDIHLQDLRLYVENIGKRRANKMEHKPREELATKIAEHPEIRGRSVQTLAAFEQLANMVKRAENEVMEREEFCRICDATFRYGDPALIEHYEVHDDQDGHLYQAWHQFFELGPKSGPKTHRAQRHPTARGRGPSPLSPDYAAALHLYNKRGGSLIRAVYGSGSSSLDLPPVKPLAAAPKEKQKPASASRKITPSAETASTTSRTSKKPTNTATPSDANLASLRKDKRIAKRTLRKTLRQYNTEKIRLSQPAHRKDPRTKLNTLWRELTDAGAAVDDSNAALSTAKKASRTPPRAATAFVSPTMSGALPARGKKGAGGGVAVNADADTDADAGPSTRRKPKISDPTYRAVPSPLIPEERELEAQNARDLRGRGRAKAKEAEADAAYKPGEGSASPSPALTGARGRGGGKDKGKGKPQAKGKTFTKSPSPSGSKAGPQSKTKSKAKAKAKVNKPAGAKPDSESDVPERRVTRKWAREHEGVEI